MKKKLILLLLILIGIIAIASLSTFFTQQANKLIREGDMAWPPNQALKKYKEAQRKWPLLFFDKELKRKIELTNQNLERYKNAPQIIAFLKKDASEFQINSLIEEINNIKGVKKVNFVSEEAALKIYKEQNKSDPILLELVTSEVLPASIEVFLNDLENGLDLKNQIYNLVKTKKIVEQAIKTPEY